MSTALATTVGTGNIAGVATAIASGGPGAIFWMWVSALFGMATKMSEVILSITYRETDDYGYSIGGPMYYIKMDWDLVGWQVHLHFWNDCFARNRQYDSIKFRCCRTQHHIWIE